jgi:hypothetical protein
MANHSNLHRPRRNGLQGDALAHANPDREIDKPCSMPDPIAMGSKGDHGARLHPTKTRERPE